MDLWNLLNKYPDHTNFLLSRKTNAQFRKELRIKELRIKSMIVGINKLARYLYANDVTLIPTSHFEEL